MTDRFEPVFIVGAPRSGTTLLRAMLNRHPRIGLCDETYFFYYVHLRARAFGDLADPSRRERLIASYLATQRMQRLQLDLPALAARLREEGRSYPAFFAAILRFWAEAHGKSRVGEKTPHHAWNTETLFEWYPGARVIHLLRDPRDVTASLFNVPWGRRSAVTNGRLWVSLTRAAERSRHRPGYLRLRYEDLIEDPEGRLTDVCRFLGETFDPAMLRADPAAGTDKPWFERAQKALTRDRVDKWRSQLTPDQIRLVESEAGALMAEFGYERSLPAAGAGLRLRGALHGMVEDLADRIKRAPRMWYFWVRPTHLAAEERWVDR